MVPKLMRMPDAMEAAMPIAEPSFLPVRPNNFAAAAQAPNVPTVPDEWKPRL